MPLSDLMSPALPFPLSAEIPYPSFLHPVAFHFPFIHWPVRWYAIMYLIGFAIGRQILRGLARRRFLRARVDSIDDLLACIFFGMIIGARMLYWLVYAEPEPGTTLPWYAPFMIWRGGLAFHGGAAGILLATALFARFQKVRFLNLADCLTLAAGPGLFFGRLGNFINSELFGRATEVPWAMRFPIYNEDTYALLGFTDPRHPSQIYEAIGEGLLGVAVAWTAKRWVKYQGQLLGLGIAYYGIARFLLEFLREPDIQKGYYFGWMTMGQILCAITFLVGEAVFVLATVRKVPVDAAHPEAPEDVVGEGGEVVAAGAGAGEVA